MKTALVSRAESTLGLRLCQNLSLVYNVTVIVTVNKARADLCHHFEYIDM